MRNGENKVSLPLIRALHCLLNGIVILQELYKHLARLVQAHLVHGVSIDHLNVTPTLKADDAIKFVDGLGWLGRIALNRLTGSRAASL